MEPTEKRRKISVIAEAKKFLSKGDLPRTFDILSKGAEKGDVMACFDAGLILLKGVGSFHDEKEGLKLIKRGMELKKAQPKEDWSSEGSVIEAMKMDSLELNCLFLVTFFVFSFFHLPFFPYILVLGEKELHLFYRHSDHIHTSLH